MAHRHPEAPNSSACEDNIGINQPNNPHRTVQTKVVIPNYHGEKLVGILHDTGSKELVIVCHGIKSVKERIPMASLAAAIENTGISAFRFDFAGNGESEGLFRYGNYRREAEDLHAVVQLFQKIGHVITTIIGHSKGGNVVLLYAAKYHDVHRVVNISGRFDLEKGIEGRLGKNFLDRIQSSGFIDVGSKSGKFQYRVTKESLMDRLSTDMRAACHLIPENCRVLTVHGSMDQIVPVKDALEFDKIITNHVLRIIQGADHEYTSHQNELVKVVLDFIRDHSRCNDTMEHSPSRVHGLSSISPRL
ncbi:hypothetical protein SOVF_016080 [Spinacia oleracea]|uniref:Serine aminopeptidase S33 domain-containing protein n=1 Tax=Spinacia oleracea TaxID=3562 RepID=A0ABM2BIV0_SPIOL|nr:putative uncharacterized protein YDL057W [Spinacia oleracea]KNA24374.1 hypothetical protein SOVF_016080 [Spinacia oleracea]